MGKIKLLWQHFRHNSHCHLKYIKNIGLHLKSVQVMVYLLIFATNEKIVKICKQTITWTDFRNCRFGVIKRFIFYWIVRIFHFAKCCNLLSEQSWIVACNSRFIQLTKYFWTKNEFFQETMFWNSRHKPSISIYAIITQ